MSDVIISTVWAMPSRWTFSIAPIQEFINRNLCGGIIIDPFSGKSEIATHRNDLANGGVDAEKFCNQLLSKGIVADTILFDPPYSPRQISECYKSIGLKVTGKDTQNAALYARVKKPLAELLKPGGVALSFGWQSSGFTKKQFTTKEILLVQHGSAHNDTICVAQTKNK